MASRYVALIRGINVGRAKRVAMADLRMLLAELSYVDVRTILNSGNVVFSGQQQQPSRIGKRVEEAMAQRLGVSGRVTVLTAAEFSRVVEENALGRVATDRVLGESTTTRNWATLSKIHAALQAESQMTAGAPARRPTRG